MFRFCFALAEMDCSLALAALGGGLRALVFLVARTVLFGVSQNVVCGSAGISNFRLNVRATVRALSARARCTTSVRYVLCDLMSIVAFAASPCLQ